VAFVGEPDYEPTCLLLCLGFKIMFSHFSVIFCFVIRFSVIFCFVKRFESHILTVANS